MEKKPEDENYRYSEDDWNLESTPENGVSGYRYSKRVAEEAAWKFAKENNIKLSVINPSFVLGPPLSTRTDSTSVKTAIGLLSGAYKKGAIPSTYGCIDVRDVALAHIRAYERPDAIENRHLVTSECCYNHLDLCGIVKDILETDLSQHANLIDNLPTTFLTEPKWKANFNITRLRNVLGIEPTPIRESLKDMIQFILDSNLVNVGK